MKKTFQDIRQTKEYARFMEKIGWKVERLNKNFVYIKKLPLLPFSVIKILRAKRLIQLNELKNITKKYHPLFIKQQPFILENLKDTSDGVRFNRTPPRWKIDRSPLIPTKTIWLDLTKTETQLLKNMHSKTRYNLRLALRKNIKVKVVPGNQITNNLITDFYSLWSHNRPFNWLFKPNFNELKYLVNSFKDKCFFVFIINHQPSTINHPLLASCLILTSSNMSFYWHNCSSRRGKARFAPTICVWEAIKESKKRGLKIFDFEGIWDERYPWLNKGWKGFSRFKKCFGGEEVEFLLPGGA